MECPHCHHKCEEVYECRECAALYCSRCKGYVGNPISALFDDTVVMRLEGPLCPLCEKGRGSVIAEDSSLKDTEHRGSGTSERIETNTDSSSSSSSESGGDSDWSGLGCLVALVIIISVVVNIVQGVTSWYHRVTYTVAPYRHALNVGDLIIDGPSQYSINIDKKKASIKLNHIGFESNWGGHTGSLRLILWARDKCCYDGGNIAGLQVASWDVNELKAGYGYLDLEESGDFSSDAELDRGRPYYFTITLNEYDGDDRPIVHWVNFKDPFIAPLKDPWWMNPWFLFGIFSFLFFLALLFVLYRYRKYRQIVIRPVRTWQQDVLRLVGIPALVCALFVFALLAIPRKTEHTSSVPAEVPAEVREPTSPVVVGPAAAPSGGSPAQKPDDSVAGPAAHSAATVSFQAPLTRDTDRELYTVCLFNIGGPMRPCVPPPADVDVDRGVVWARNPIKSGNLRTGPGTEHVIVGDILPYEVAHVIGQVRGKNWYLIRHDIGSGWAGGVPPYIRTYYKDPSNAEVYVSAALFALLPGKEGGSP